METITLHRDQILWNARFSDQKIIKLFGTDTIPTSFKATTKSVDVLRAIQTMNPDMRVIIGEEL